MMAAWAYIWLYMENGSLYYLNLDREWPEGWAHLGYQTARPLSFSPCSPGESLLPQYPPPTGNLVAEFSESKSRRPDFKGLNQHGNIAHLSIKTKVTGPTCMFIVGTQRFAHL